MIYTLDNCKCKLCLKNDLESVGSHIFPDFLIRGAIYQDGKNKRGDYETIFEIGETEANAKFFGSSVLPELREELLGHKQSEKEIEATKKNPFIDTTLVCRQCEKRFGPVESAFKSLIYDKMVDNKSKVSNQDDFVYHSFSEEEYYLAFLLVLINTWRASASNNYQWKMREDIEESTRYFLDEVLNNDISETLKSAKDKKLEIKNVNFTLHFTEQTSGVPSQNVVFIDLASSPSMFVTNQLIALFSENNFDTVNPPHIVSDVIDRSKVLKLIDDVPNTLKVHHICNNDRLELLQNYRSRQVKKVWEYIADLYKKACVKVLGGIPSPNEIQSDMEKFIEIVEGYGMFTADNIIKALAKVLYHKK